MHRGRTASDFSRAANGDDTVLTAIEVNKAWINILSLFLYVFIFADFSKKSHVFSQMMVSLFSSTRFDKSRDQITFIYFGIFIIGLEFSIFFEIISHFVFKNFNFWFQFVRFVGTYFMSLKKIINFNIQNFQFFFQISHFVTYHVLLFV